jgi:holo-[acyl-carrier protein] synthase
MSVLGVGIDLVDIGSFDSQLALVGSSMAMQTFTPAELAEADQVAADATRDPDARARRLAGRFAAKEAFLKAWSSARLGRAPALADLRWVDVEVLNDPWGRPFLRPSGDTGAAVLESLGALDIHLSITHDGPVAAAVVVLDAAGGRNGQDPGDRP